MRSDKEIIRGMQQEHDRLIEMGRETEAERDAAIERGVAVWKGAEQQRGMLLLLLWMRTVEHDDDHEALDRAEARETALREALRKILPYAEAYDPAEYGGEEPTQEVDIAAARAILEGE